MIIWVQRHPDFHPEMLGLIPSFLDERDPRDAKTQLDAGYGYGGFWMGADDGVELGEDDAMLYPDDPPQPALAECRFRGERILFYPAEFIGVVAADGTFAVQRMD